MLNLITGQAVFRYDNTSEQHSIASLKQLSKQSLDSFAYPHTIKAPELDEYHFKLDTSCASDYYMRTFMDAIFKCTLVRLVKPILELDTPLMVDIRKYLPHFTPAKGEAIVYTTVDEALASNALEVGAYLDKLKADLCIGMDGHPDKILLTGDQQTYKIMKDLQKQQTEKYKWFYSYPGDWHLMKLMAELFKLILWDGGLKEMCNCCGQEDITQWQDIHNLLAALHEVLLWQLVNKYKQDQPQENFWEFIAHLSEDSNHNRVSQFWAQMTYMINSYMGFFFAIRSGNFMLRNSCLKIMAPIFFAYSRNNYEELTLNTLTDSLTLPQYILDKFMHGEWTASIKGRPYHNVALDEAHECVINRRLKQITSRPSHFRTVQLADFMAYMDILLSGIEEWVNKNKANSNTEYNKNLYNRELRELTA